MNMTKPNEYENLNLAIRRKMRKDKTQVKVMKTPSNKLNLNSDKREKMNYLKCFVKCKKNK